MKEVITKIIANIPNIIAAVPEITFVKYKIAITAAITMRIALSNEPIFFFMIYNIYRYKLRLMVLRKLFVTYVIIGFMK